jgi:regulator of CtrA degradation
LKPIDPGTAAPGGAFEGAAVTRAEGRMIRRLLDESMALVRETTAYFDGRGRSDQNGLPNPVALLYAGESMRVTTRLMQVVAWLLAQRAVEAGEISRDEAVGPRFRLGARRVCLGEAPGDVGGLPPTLRDLLARSEGLYLRIERLERLLVGEAPTPPTPGRGLRLVSF